MIELFLNLLALLGSLILIGVISVVLLVVVLVIRAAVEVLFGDK